MSWAPLRTVLLVLLSFCLFSENEGYAKNDNVNIFYLDHGPKEGTPILMIQGLGAQLTYWPDELIFLLQQNGYRPIVFDNRDAGLSDNFDLSIFLLLEFKSVKIKSIEFEFKNFFKF